MRLKTRSVLPWTILVAAVPVMSSCALKNDLEDAASGCDEFQAGGEAVGTLKIDAKVKAFAQASAELKQVGDGIKADVKLACINIAKDLGEEDRWSADDADSALSNSGKTGACDVAASRIDAILTTASADLGANFGLEVSGGQCSIDAEAQAELRGLLQNGRDLHRGHRRGSLPSRRAQRSMRRRMQGRSGLPGARGHRDGVHGQVRSRMRRDMLRRNARQDGGRLHGDVRGQMRRDQDTPRRHGQLHGNLRGAMHPAPPQGKVPWKVLVEMRGQVQGRVQE